MTFSTPPKTLQTLVPTIIRAFRRNGFAKRVASGEAWRRANDGFEQFVYESRKTASELTVDMPSMDGSQPWRRRPPIELESLTASSRLLISGGIFRSISYRRQFNDFLDTPPGRSFATLFFVWLALSGWLFRVLIFVTWVLPFAGPLLIGAVANSLVINVNSFGGECRACRKQFAGYKNQTVRCASYGNIVLQPQGDFFTRAAEVLLPLRSLNQISLMLNLKRNE